MAEKITFSMIPIEKTDVYKSAFVQLDRLIDENHMQPGTRLPSERELCALLGVSRTTVRQGIKVLESMGKVETKAGSGTYVTAKNILSQFGLQDAVIDEKFISDLCCAREGVERTVFAAFMNGCNTAKNLRELETLLDRQEKQMEATTIADEWVDAVYEFRFEETVGRLTQNQIIANQQKQMHQLWSYAWAEIGCVPERRAVLHLEHRLLFEAMRHGDLDRMYDRIKKHVNKSVQHRRA